MQLYGIQEILVDKFKNANILFRSNYQFLESTEDRRILVGNAKKIEAELLGLGNLSIPVASKKSIATSNEKAEKQAEIESMEEVEKRHIAKVLADSDGNRTHAADKLGLNVRTLRNKIKQYYFARTFGRSNKM